MNNIYDLIKDNPYPGRGIIVGESGNGRYAVCAYFIMGRSANSRNRVLALHEGELFTEPYDVSRVEDPSLIIYRAFAGYENKLIVTNGDQTDTIYEGLKQGKSMAESLKVRKFEPDSPNYTPRISAVVNLRVDLPDADMNCRNSISESNKAYCENSNPEYEGLISKNSNPKCEGLTSENSVSDDKGLNYEISILKSADDKGSACSRFYYSYEALPGTGHFIHTYMEDGNPLPSFEGEPEAVTVPDAIDEFTKQIWNGLNEDNRISLYVRYTDLETLKYEERLVNKN